VAALPLEEKLKYQREIKALESARNAKRKSFFEAQDDDEGEFGRIPGFAGNRAFRLYLLTPAASKGYRFNPLRGEGGNELVTK
jgi:hypothetical protein